VAHSHLRSFLIEVKEIQHQLNYFLNAVAVSCLKGSAGLLKRDSLEIMFNQRGRGMIKNFIFSQKHNGNLCVQPVRVPETEDAAETVGKDHLPVTCFFFMGNSNPNRAFITSA
jgi:hypothetical protein